MALTDHVDMQGFLTIQIHDLSQHLMEEVKVKNDIVTDGREIVAKQFAGIEVDTISHLAVGTGGIKDDDTKKDVNPTQDKALTTEVSRKEFSKTPVVEQMGDGHWKVIVETTLEQDEANDEKLSEAGLFNGEDKNSSKMYNRVTFKPINKSKDFTLTLKWEIIF